MKKALFLDMDGTMLNDKKEFTPGNRKAVKQALADGHKVIISTGRPLVSAIALAKNLDLTSDGCFVISFNGGEIYDLYNQKSIYKKTLPLEYVRYIFDKAHEYGLHCQTYNDTQVLAEKDTAALKRYTERIKMPSVIVPDVIAALKEEPVKVLVIDLDDHQKLERFRSATAEWTEGKMDRMFSSIDYLEHIAPGISKGNAVRFLCDYLGIDIKDTIAAGDAENDISMLEAAHIGVAMANAGDAVKDIADHITEMDNNHDGVAEIIEKFL